MDSAKVVYTCGICETIFQDWANDPCIEGYSRLFMDDNHYFYPMTDDGNVIRRSRLDDGIEAVVEDEIPSAKGKENVGPKEQASKPLKSRVQSQVPKRPLCNNRNGKLTDAEIELFILEVEKRIPLWNFSIPIEERNRETTSKLWEEVSTALDGKLSADDAKKKFKGLRDVHRRIVHAEQFPSGSGRATPREKWKFYGQMEFLRDTCLIRPTSSNVSRLNNEEEDRDELNPAVVLEENVGEHVNGEDESSKRMRRRSTVRDTAMDESMAVLNRIADAMSREEPVPAPPPPPQMDDVDGFLVGVGVNLRRLPMSERMETIIEILNVVHRKCQKYATDT